MKYSSFFLSIIAITLGYFSMQITGLTFAENRSPQQISENIYQESIANLNRIANGLPMANRASYYREVSANLDTSIETLRALSHEYTSRIWVLSAGNSEVSTLPQNTNQTTGDLGPRFSLNDCSYGGKIFYPTRYPNPTATNLGNGKWNFQNTTSNFSPNVGAQISTIGMRGYIPNISMLDPTLFAGGGALGFSTNGNRPLTSPSLNTQFWDDYNPANGINSPGGLPLESSFPSIDTVKYNQNIMTQCWIKAIEADGQTDDPTGIRAKLQSFLDGTTYVQYVPDLTNEFDSIAGSGCFGTVTNSYYCSGLLGTNIESWDGKIIRNGDWNGNLEIRKFDNGTICYVSSRVGTGLENITRLGSTNGQLNFKTSVLDNTNICLPIKNCTGPIRATYSCNGIIANNVPSSIFTLQPATAPFEYSGKIEAYANGAICGSFGEVGRLGYTRWVSNWDPTTLQRPEICTLSTSQWNSTGVTPTVPNQTNLSTPQSQTCPPPAHSEETSYYRDITDGIDYFHPTGKDYWCQRNRSDNSTRPIGTLPVDLFTNSTRYKITDPRSF